jgi:Raf kinase inhibitor-like YbhB/YbcL family protein
MKLTSDQFKNNDMIPKKYTCVGDNINPPLNIEDLPPGTQSLVLIIDDPDSLKGTFIHWVAYDIPVTSQIKENSTPGTIGINDFKNRNYGGPCPQFGTHHYHFKIYALDTRLDLPEGQTNAQIERAMINHVLDQAELIGSFTREALKLVGR